VNVADFAIIVVVVIYSLTFHSFDRDRVLNRGIMGTFRPTHCASQVGGKVF